MSWKIGAKQKFLDQRTPSSLLPIPAPDWGITVYYWPATTMAEERYISNAFQLGVAASIEEEERKLKFDRKARDVATLIARARNEHGQPLFDHSEVDDLMERYDPREIERIAGLMDSESVTVEQAEKN